MHMQIQDPDRVTLEIPWVLGEAIIKGPCFYLQLDGPQTMEFMEAVLEWEDGRFILEFEDLTLIIHAPHMDPLQQKVRQIRANHDERDREFEELAAEREKDDYIREFDVPDSDEEARGRRRAESEENNTAN